MGLGPTELLIILAIALLLFGGTRLAGLGKGVGRSIREFKEEVKTGEEANAVDAGPEVVEAEIVQPQIQASQSEADRRIADLEARERDLRAREEELRHQRETGSGV